MTLDPALRSELADFCAALADNQLAAADARRLEALVAADDEARDYFLGQQLLRAELELHYGVVETSATRPSPPVKTWRLRAYAALRRPTPISITVAALVVGVLLAGLAFVAVPHYRQRADVAAPPQGEFVAKLTAVRNVVWSDGQVGRGVGARLVQGHRLELQAGYAEVTFDSGARVLLEGRGKLQIASKNAARVEHGRIVAFVPPAARGFTVSTPTMEVVDLGTEFGLETDGDRQNAVTVFQGAVTLAARRNGVAGTPRRIVAGETASVVGDRVAVAATASAPASPRFARHLPPHIIAEVWSSTGRPYRVAAEGLHEDARAYTDELHQWNGIDESGMPDELRGVEYVRTANLDRTGESYDVYVRVSRPARLYVFWSKNTRAPEWLARDFVDSGLTIGMDAIAGRGWPREPGVGAGESVEIVKRVWQRDIAQPQVVHLGPTNHKGHAVFGIAAAPLEEDAD